MVRTDQCRRLRLTVVSAAPPRVSKLAPAAAGGRRSIPVLGRVPPRGDVDDAEGEWAPEVGVPVRVDVWVDVALADDVVLLVEEALDVADAVPVVVVVVDGVPVGVAVPVGDPMPVVVAVGVPVVVVVGVPVGVVLEVAVALVEGLAVAVLVAVLHTGRVMVLVSRVTAPLRASSRPATVAPVFALMDVRARMLPLNVVFVPRVAELPTCQNTLQGWAPLIRETLLPEPVIRVLATWKMNTALGSPWASSVTVPVRPRLELDL